MTLDILINFNFSPRFIEKENACRLASSCPTFWICEVKIFIGSQRISQAFEIISFFISAHRLVSVKARFFIGLKEFLISHKLLSLFFFISPEFEGGVSEWGVIISHTQYLLLPSPFHAFNVRHGHR